jgi:tetratricopeptide (TPR) repeat protein
VRITQSEAVYPAFLSLYQRNEAGRLTISNQESAEIEDIRVSFRAGTYTSSEYMCGTIARIGRAQEADLPLYADFSPEILNFTENGRIVGEVVIRYRLLGEERETIKTGALSVYKRGYFSGADSAGLAAFVSPLSPEALEYAKYVTGLSRSRLLSGINRNLQFAIWLFAGLRAQGVGIRGKGAQDEVQFPSQTLAYKSGTGRDACLLYLAALEAAGIRAAFIPLDGGPDAPPRCIAAVSLGISEAAAGSSFNGTDSLVIVNDEAWLPLSPDALDDGFTASWQKAAERLVAAVAAGEDIDFIILEDAWASYPPAPFPALGVRISQAAEGAISSAADAAIKDYIAGEIQPMIKAVNAQIRGAAGPALAALYNRLGNLYIRSGQTVEAKASFERAAGLGSAAGMTNRGTMALLDKDYAAAEKWFAQALRAQPDNAAALRGLQQTVNR